MKSLFKSVFSRSKDKTPERNLTKPDHLQVGDMLKLADSYGIPVGLRDQMLQVVEVNTYQFEHQHEPEWLLKSDSGLSIFMSIDREDGGESVRFAQKIERDLVEQCFDLDEFAEIFEPGQVAELRLLNTPESLQGWLAPHYRQDVSAELGYYFNRDYRGTKPPSYEGDGSQPFQTHGLTSSDEKFRVDIEIWEGGETDVCVNFSRPVTDIKELWPGTSADV